MKKNYFTRKIALLKKMILFSFSLFSLFLNAQSPGGVSNGLRLWLRADTGTVPATTGVLTAWDDLALGNNAGQFSPDPTPSLIDGSATVFNFNKAVRFSSITQKIGNITSSTINTANYDVITVVRNGVTGNRFFSIGRNNTLFDGTNWDTPCFNINGTVAIRKVSDGSLSDLYSNPFMIGSSNSAISYNLFQPNYRAVGGNGNAGISAGGTADPGIPTGGYIIGANSGAITSGDDSGFIGDVGEFIIYNRNLTYIERRKVDSYLGIKYGLTLAFPSSMPNYIASDGNVIWDSTLNSAYNSRITGIGRDDVSGLLQKQSISALTGALVTIGKGTISTTNVTNGNNFSQDKDFLLFGDNSSGITTFSSTGAPTNMLILPRIWKVQETGTDNQDFMISVPDNSDANATKLPLETSVVYLVQDADGDFTNGAIQTPMVLNGTNWEVNNIDLDSGQYFSFVTENPLSIDNFDNVNLALYPNPFENIFNISSDIEGEIKVYDYIGKELFTKMLNGRITEIDMNSFSDGVYILKVFSNSKFTKVFKIVKK